MVCKSWQCSADSIAEEFQTDIGFLQWVSMATYKPHNYKYNAKHRMEWCIALNSEAVQTCSVEQRIMLLCLMGESGLGRYQ